MSHWDYRIVKHHADGGDSYGLHEVFYDDNGNPVSMTKDAIGFVGESAGDVISQLETALLDARRKPTLIEPAEWGGLGSEAHDYDPESDDVQDWADSEDADAGECNAVEGD